MMVYQRTIQSAIQFKGIGLHTGREATVTLKPAKPDRGIVFFRTDLKEVVRIPALNRYVTDSALSTTIGRQGVKIATIEHLMAAIWGMGIDNIKIEVSGPEIPILDGSSAPFVDLLSKCGIAEQKRSRQYYVITKAFSLQEGGHFCAIEPHAESRFSCSIEFDHPAIQKQSFDMTLNEKNFSQELAPARTFGFLKDIEMLRQRGLIAGGSLENAIVLDHEKVLNAEPLRFEDEFVRHKMLDSVGDLALFGMRILGHWVTHKAGHKIHAEFCSRLLKSGYGYITDQSREQIPLPLPAFDPILQTA
jgi:UDP-3-O-[3-hydroxymyristoyl] N-acetylglucosamine deacetylase